MKSALFLVLLSLCLCLGQDVFTEQYRLPLGNLNGGTPFRMDIGFGVQGVDGMITCTVAFSVPGVTNLTALPAECSFTSPTVITCVDFPFLASGTSSTPNTLIDQDFLIDACLNTSLVITFQIDSETHMETLNIVTSATEIAVALGSEITLPNITSSSSNAMPGNSSSTGPASNITIDAVVDASVSTLFNLTMLVRNTGDCITEDVTCVIGLSENIFQGQNVTGIYAPLAENNPFVDVCNRVEFEVTCPDSRSTYNIPFGGSEMVVISFNLTGNGLLQFTVNCTANGIIGNLPALGEYNILGINVPEPSSLPPLSSDNTDDTIPNIVIPLVVWIFVQVILFILIIILVVAYFVYRFINKEDDISY